MSLRLYDTATRSVRDFHPLQDGKVSIYVCGVTVQGPPHIGHIRSGLSYDVMSRWFAHRGYHVTVVRNFTDVDDKIIAKAAAEGVPFWVLGARNERAVTWAYEVLGCLPVTVEPRATGHIPEMIQLMHRLIDSGHAYSADGDVYFDVGSFPDYGALSGQRVDEMLPAADSDSAGKRDPRDFALWKAAKPGEPAWDTPWGPGRPGWHLECSAMAHRYLGPAFDIHGGGLDLVFPHHENERAQSNAVGDPFASYWAHHAWVTTSGEKMSKSLGNSLLVTEVVRRVRPVELRYYLVSPHYRSHIEFSEEALVEAGAGYRRLEQFVRNATERVGVVEPTFACPDFELAMDDDIGVPAALAALHDVVREGNRALAAGDEQNIRGTLGSVRSMLQVLGLDPQTEPWASEGGDDGRVRSALDRLVSEQLARRQQARANKDFATADAVRDLLVGAGIDIEDTASGPRWSLREDA